MKRFLILIIFELVLHNGWADDGPLIQNNGAFGPMVYPLSLDKKSCIRMDKEYLTFLYSRDSTQVIAKFYFSNTDKRHSVTQMTGFPDVALGMIKMDSDKSYERDFSNYWNWASEEPLENMETLVDGFMVPSKVEYGFVDDKNWVPGTKGKDDLIGWYIVNLVFPPGGKKILERRYACSNGVAFTGYLFNYIVYTGGGWYGNIGELKADLILGKGVKEQSIQVEPGLFDWDKVGRETYRLLWKDFDPRQDQNKRGIRVQTN